MPKPDNRRCRHSDILPGVATALPAHGG
jgi:hypothetical protein